MTPASEGRIPKGSRRYPSDPKWMDRSWVQASSICQWIKKLTCIFIFRCIAATSKFDSNLWPFVSFDKPMMLFKKLCARSCADSEAAGLLSSHKTSSKHSLARLSTRSQISILGAVCEIGSKSMKSDKCVRWYEPAYQEDLWIDNPIVGLLWSLATACFSLPTDKCLGSDRQVHSWQPYECACHSFFEPDLVQSSILF